MKKTIDLSRYTPEFVLGRRDALVTAAGDRNAMMTRFEDMYKMDVYEQDSVSGAEASGGGNSSDTMKISLPLAFSEVEKHRGMMLAKPPSISVPYAGADVSLQARAQKLERYLYGVMEMSNLTGVMSLWEWSANCRGRGWVKAVYDDGASEGEYPIKPVEVDPKTIFCEWNPQRDRPVELVQVIKRTRRSLRDEYGDKAVATPATIKDVEPWLDEEVDTVDYWAEHVVWQMPEEDEAVEKDEALPLVIELAAATTLQAMTGGRARADTQTLGARMAEAEAPYEKAEEGAGGKGKKKKAEQVRVRKVVHGVLMVGVGTGADGHVWAKKPVAIPGYMELPFFGISGIATPLEGGREALSLLYPLSRGDADGSVQGVLQAMNTLASLYLQEAVAMSNAALVTDDPNAQIDTSTPNYLNRLEPGRTLQYLNRPSTMGPLGGGMEFLKGVMYQVGMPEILAAGRTASLSGQSVDSQGAEYEMRLALRQRERERQLERLFRNILCLTRQWADPDEGWTVSGSGRYGNGYFEETVKPEDIGTNYRVKVKLSTSTPRDVVSTISMLLNALGRNAISLETFLDQFQQYVGLASDSPEDEIKKILRGMFITSGKLTEQIAEQLGQEYVARLTGDVGGIPMPREEPRAKSQEPRPEGMPPEMSMAGMPITPEIVAAMGNPEGATNMVEGSAEGLGNGG